MFKVLADRLPRDKQLPPRAHTILVRKAVLEGTIYDNQPCHWHEERNGAGEYVPVADRAPSVRYSLCRMVVEDSVALLFGDGHFPGIQCDDDATLEALKALVAETRLDALMMDAAHRGSVGSVAIRLRVLNQRPFFDVFDTAYLTPVYDPEAPDTLVGIKEQYRVKGRDLADLGYQIDDDMLGADFWFRREWDENDETWFIPQPVIDEKPPQIDASRSVSHRLGFCPWVWIKNLPGGDGVDGWCTFRPAIETQIEIEYQLSLGARALKYSSAPTLLLKSPATSGAIMFGAGDTILVDESGDGKWLEIDGNAAKAVIEYVRSLRELALESVHGNRSNADKVSAAQSGRAQELMHQPLIWLADKLRTSYGECGLLPLLRMVVKAAQRYPLRIAGKPVKMAGGADISLLWPRWFPLTADDRQADGSTLATLTSRGLMSRETAVKQLAPVYDVPDVDAEISAIMSDEAQADARAAEQKAQIKATEQIQA
jgi:hypothetical protein